jgi:hypothetical protein
MAGYAFGYNPPGLRVSADEVIELDAIAAMPLRARGLRDVIQCRKQDWIAASQVLLKKRRRCKGRCRMPFDDCCAGYGQG